MPRQQALTKVARGRDHGVSAPQERRFERVAEDSPESRSTHLVGLAHRAPFVAVVEHDAEPAGAGQRREQELREGRSADENDVVAPCREARDERAMGRRLPEHLRVRKEELPGDPRSAAAVASCRVRTPSGLLCRVSRLECPGASDLELAWQIVSDRVVSEGNAGVCHGEHRRSHAVLGQVLGELGYALHAGTAHRRKRVRDEECAKLGSHVRTPSATPILVLSMSASPLITIAMPCRDEEAHIEACIRSVQAQDWPGDRMEILVADGMSIDATREILARLAAEDAPHSLDRQPGANPGCRSQRVRSPRAGRRHRAHGRAC